MNTKCIQLNKKCIHYPARRIAPAIPIQLRTSQSSREIPACLRILTRRSTLISDRWGFLDRKDEVATDHVRVSPAMKRAVKTERLEFADKFRP